MFQRGPPPLLNLPQRSSEKTRHSVLISGSRFLLGNISPSTLKKQLYLHLKDPKWASEASYLLIASCGLLWIHALYYRLSLLDSPQKKKSVLLTSHLSQPPPHPPNPLLPLKQAGSHQFSLWPKDTNNQEGLDSNPVFTFICHTFKGKLCQAYSSQRKCSMEKMRRITVNNIV